VALRVGDSDEVKALVQRGGTNGVGTLAALAAKLPTSETCVSYEWIDLRGKTLRDEPLCTPDRCFLLKHEGAMPVSTCGDGVFPTGTAVWDELPKDSCKAPPVLTADSRGRADTTEDDGDLGSPATASKSGGAAESGCALTAAPGRAGSGAWMLLGALALLIRRRAER